MRKNNEIKRSSFSKTLQLIKIRKYKGYLIAFLACFLVAAITFPLALVAKNLSFLIVFALIPFFFLTNWNAIANTASNYLSTDAKIPFVKTFKFYLRGTTHVIFTIFKSFIYSLIISSFLLAIISIIINFTYRDGSFIDDLYLYLQDPSVALPNIEFIQNVVTYSRLLTATIFSLFIIFLNRKYELAIHLATYYCNIHANHYLFMQFPKIHFKKLYRHFAEQYRKSSWLTDLLTAFIFSLGVMVGTFVGIALSPHFELLSISFCGLSFGFLFYGFLHGFIRSYDTVVMKSKCMSYIAEFPEQEQCSAYSWQQRSKRAFADDVFHPQYILVEINENREVEENIDIYTHLIICSRKGHELDLSKDLHFDRKKMLDDFFDTSVNNEFVKKATPPVFGLYEMFLEEKDKAQIDPPSIEQPRTTNENEENQDER